MGQTGSNVSQTPRSREGSTGTNNLPPLLFHQVHGDFIRILKDGTVAKRTESFCKGVTFTNRPVKISEKVYFKLLEVSSNWSGVIRFGFTSVDPSDIRYGLPRYACPDLTNKPGFWAKALAEFICEQNKVVYFYVTSAGDVHFGINGEDRGIFFSGVDTRNPLWAIFDVYGNTTAIELLDSRHHLNNNRRSPHSTPADLNVEIDTMIVPSMASLNVAHMDVHGDVPSSCGYAQPRMYQAPLTFHRTRGRNIRLSNDRCIATRSEAEYCQGYVFTSRPLQIGEEITIQILATDSLYHGAIALGLTSCDPATLQPNDLPDDSDLLIDRSEYWVVNKDVANGPQRGDKLTFCINSSGAVQMSKNGSNPITLMHVDHSSTLWAFLDVYGSTRKICILNSTMAEIPRPALPIPAVVTREEIRTPPTQVVPTRVLRVALPETDYYPQIQQEEVVQIGRHQILTVNLPPPAEQFNRANHSNHAQENMPNSSTLISNYSNTYIEPVASRQYSSPSFREWAETSVSSPSGSECTVCYERGIDSVLYMCGHMCMCYQCALKQWKGVGGGHCPLCRAIIRDVIRTYKS